MKLYNRKSLISAAPEGQPSPSSKSSITQWIYFILVALMVGYLVYLLLKPYYMIEAQGLVDVEVKEIVAERSGVLQDVFVGLNQPFKKGELLARIAAEKQCLPEDNAQADKLGYDMDVLATDIKALQQELNYVAAIQQPSTGMLRALEVNASLFQAQQKEQQSVQQAQQKLKLDIQRAKDKLAIMAARRQSLQLAFDDKPVAADCTAKDVWAFEDGTVTDMRVTSQTYAEKGRPILKYLSADAKARVVFLADANLYRSFAKQPQLVVTFPDGAESLARIAQIESIASQVSGNLNDLLGLDKVSLRMVLVPMDPADNALWRTFERLPVSVRGVR
ncbi:hypothetical protein [Rheinheimera maricola]|uniref:HlyD family secretion protein n=1 Tax=Rheinheimera maricola TaxID=2793282 RepID=A0ABS7XDM0_9GAMM|nr:hypothetical protein [Rheinheimera maricola]MBZ9613244.1 hypothetical protein [Rheinheimera maricola]